MIWSFTYVDIQMFLVSDTYKTSDGKELTPVHRLGITDNVFNLKDIIYHRLLKMK